MTVDFLPAQDLRGMRTRPISRDTVLAMYLNNRAAEALAARKLDEAYWWARRGIERVPRALTAYNTLAVVYIRRGALTEAEGVLRHVHAIEPANTKVLFNLAQTLERRNAITEAVKLRKRLAELEGHPPFHFFDLGLASMSRGDYAAAKRQFAQELARSSEYHEFHFAMALATYHLGDRKASHTHMQKAIALSHTSNERELYAAKAQKLRTLLQ